MKNLFVVINHHSNQHGVENLPDVPKIVKKESLSVKKNKIDKKDKLIAKKTFPTELDSKNQKSEKLNQNQIYRIIDIKYSPFGGNLVLVKLDRIVDVVVPVSLDLDLMEEQKDKILYLISWGLEPVGFLIFFFNYSLFFIISFNNTKKNRKLEQCLQKPWKQIQQIVI